MIYPLISIVIPVYNTKTFLAQCVDSILLQTYKNFECILVDDGSSDGSGELCDDYSLKDDRVSVFHIQNGGVSKARNYGIAKAKGQYISFIDSDDFVLADYLETMVAPIMQSYICYDLICSGFRVIDNNGRRDFSCHNLYIDKRNNIKNLLPLLDSKQILNGPCCKLYKRDIIISNNLKFPEQLSLGEDLIFNCIYIKYVGNIINIDYLGYMYCHRNNDSLTKQKYAFSYYETLIDTQYRIRTELDYLLQSDDNRYRIYIENKCLSSFLYYLPMLYYVPNNRKIYIKKYLSLPFFKGSRSCLILTSLRHFLLLSITYLNNITLIDKYWYIIYKIKSNVIKC